MITKSGSALRRAVRLSLLTAAASVAVPAVAQTDIDAVVVTGTRIAKRDAIAESPILSVDAETLDKSGYVAIEQYLNTLPQLVPGISSQSNNPSSNGRAFLDLRGLGSNRNLVLIDGRRGMGSTSGGVVDINTIPAALIERVEVISGGAAAVYGPDAVAGVVNFIMRKDFEGFEIDSGYHITEEDDGMQWGSDITFGGKFADGMGRAVFNASYYKRDDMYKSAREFSAQAGTTTGTFPGGGWSTGANQPTQAAVDAAFGAGGCQRTGGQAGFQFNPDGSLFCTGTAASPFDVVGFNGPDAWIATAFYPDFFSYNFEPDNILILPMERWSLYSNVQLDLNERFQPYVQAMFTNYNALQELAPTPAAGTTGFTVPVSNPFVQANAQLSALLASRTVDPAAPFSFSKRFNDVGGRTGYNTHDVWQLVTGVKGDIASDWTYDFYASYGRSVQNEVQGGNIRRDRVQALLNAADGGASVCAGGLNLFGASPGVTLSDACIAYISLEAKNLTTVIQRQVEAVATGGLFDLPAGKVQAAVGASWRDIDFDFQPDGGLQPGLVAGFNQQLPISGNLDYTDVFLEVSVPILSDLPLVKSLSFTGGIRTTDNNLFGSEETWKATLDWSITDSWRFRGGLQYAVRSPNIAELFSPQLNNFPNIANSDPCNSNSSFRLGADDLVGGTGANADGPDAAAVAALCGLQSSLADDVGFRQPFGQATAIVGGNPGLSPETADSWSAGLVFTPTMDSEMINRLSVSVDYFRIELSDVIASVDATTIIQRCYNREGANPTLDINNSWCQLFNREQSNGGIIDLELFQQNQAFWNVGGIDVAFDIGFQVGPGDLGFNIVAAWLEKNEQQTSVADPVLDYAGSIGGTTGSASPEWKGTISTSYSWDDLQLQLVTRYIDDMIHANNVAGTAGVGTDSIWYHDLTGTYNLTDKITIRAGINNLTDEDPELYTPFVQANTDPSTYDVLGRRFFLGLNARF